MRLALVLHAFPPRERTGVETYAEALARALAAGGHSVEVFAPRKDPRVAHLWQHREERDGFGVTWLSVERDADREEARRSIPGADRAFARFLDREQPEVLHFQHLYKLGPALIDVARERDLPVVFTGHDPYPVSSDYTLLAPDLTPLDPLDREALARASLARGVLDRHLAAHDGFLPVGEADTELARGVLGLLHGELAPEDREALERRASRIDEELGARLRLLERVDRIEVPTRALAELYRRGGLDSDRVEVHPCGIDLAPFVGLPPVEASAGPLRVLYLGGYYEHKGVHVLLEAVEPLRQSVRLVLRGCAGSSSYAAHLAARAREVGARFGGRFDRTELPALLREADLVVLPSIWPENAPFVIREAFAAGRPVVASDTPALRESVRDGVDGRLFPQGDAGALREVLSELAADRSRLVALAAGIRPPLSIEEDARSLAERHAPLVESRKERSRRRLERLPEHLRELAERYEALLRLPTRELLERAERGLEQVADHLGVEADVSLLALLPERLRERFAEARRARAWQEAVAEDRGHEALALRGELEQAEGRTAELEERCTWLEGLVAERDGRVQWLEEGLADRRRAVEAKEAELGEESRRRAEVEERVAELGRTAEALGRERDWLLEGRRENELRADWLQRTLEVREEELSWRRGTLEAQTARVEALERGLREASSALERADGEREDWLAERRALLDERDALFEEREAWAKERAAWLDEREVLEADNDSRGRELDVITADLEALRAHEAWLRGELARILAPLLGEERAPTPAETGEWCLRARKRLSALRREHSWRAREMLAAAREARSLAQRCLGGALRRRVAGWGSKPVEEPEETER